jgi:DNA-binding MarR family transcriptional regulator
MSEQSRRSRKVATRFSLVQGLVHDLLAVSGETQAFFRATAQAFGLTPVEAQVVYDLARGPQTATVLAQRVRVQKSNLTAVLDRLEDRALLTRRASDSDRRVRELVLTAHGDDVARDFVGQLVAGAPVAVRLTREELTVLSALLAKARAADAAP